MNTSSEAVFFISDDLSRFQQSSTISVFSWTCATLLIDVFYLQEISSRFLAKNWVQNISSFHRDLDLLSMNFMELQILPEMDQLPTEAHIPSFYGPIRSSITILRTKTNNILPSFIKTQLTNEHCSSSELSLPMNILCFLFNAQQKVLFQVFHSSQLLLLHQQVLKREMSISPSHSL